MHQHQHQYQHEDQDRPARVRLRHSLTSPARWAGTAGSAAGGWS